jgi:carboxymethylenebutenolidase
MTETMTRRAFVTSGLATGFALAVQPVSAETIQTDSKGLTAGEVKVKAPDGVEIPAYRAMPEKGDKLPVVLVVQEIFGVHEHIKDICRRFAKKGYFAIAPELYYRQGDVSKMKDFQEIISQVVSKVPDAQVMSDLDAAVVYAKGTGKADTDKLAITGFCWGGRIVWLYAAHNPKVKAGGAWYGMLTRGFGPGKNPIDIAPTLTVPVLGQYGGQDQGIPQSDVEKMREALKQGKSGSEIIVYPDAAHGFNADYRPSYNEKDAKEGFAKLLAWFKDHGAA